MALTRETKIKLISALKAFAELNLEHPRKSLKARYKITSKPGARYEALIQWIDVDTDDVIHEEKDIDIGDLIDEYAD